VETYSFSSQSSLTLLFKVQSNALRLCTGAMTSTSIVCLQHTCHEMPLHIKHRLLCFEYKVHLLTFREHPGLSLVTDCWQAIFPDTRNFCSFNMFTKHSGLPSHLGALQVPNLPPWSLQQPNQDLNALVFIRRPGSHLIAPLIKSYIHEHYSHHVGYIFT